MASLEGTKTDRQALTGNIAVKPGVDGESVTITNITESTEDGGTNTVKFSDGSILKIKNGSSGKNGKDGKDGADGADGNDGKSAYQYAQDGGYTGTEEEFALLMAQENLQTEKVSKLSEDIATKASAIKEKASGEVIVVTDSDEKKPLGLAIDGKSEQNQYRGTNLVDFGNIKPTSNSRVSFADDVVTVAQDDTTLYQMGEIRVTDLIVNNPGKTVSIGFEKFEVTNSNAKAMVQLRIYFKDGTATIYNVLYDHLKALHGDCTIPSDTSNVSYANLNVIPHNNNEALANTVTITKPIVYLGAVAEKPNYEPYCGGIPSPNTQYKQEIRNIGVYDEASGKYAVEVKCATEDGSKETTATVYLDEPLRKDDKAYWNGGSKIRVDRYRDIKVFDGSVDEVWNMGGTNEGQTKFFYIANPLCAKSKDSLCTSLLYKDINSSTSNIGFDTHTSQGQIRFRIEGIVTIENWIAYLAENPITVEYPLETPITEEINIDLGELSMFYPTTILSNDCNANMEVTYIADTKAYIDKKFAELATAMV